MGGDAIFLILDPREAYISNLSLLACLKKVSVGGGGGWCVNLV